MPGIPVVIAANGLGMPVKSVTANAPVMTVATNGRGIPIVLSDRGAPFVVEGGVIPPVIPTNDWRLPITIANTGDTTWNNAIVASNTAKTIPLKTAAVPASTTQTYTFVHPTGLETMGGLIYLDWIASGTVVPTFTYEYSLNTTDGTDGTWQTSPFTPWRPSGHTLATQYTMVGQLINIPVGSKGSRLTIQTPASVTCRPYLGFFRLTGGGTEPLFAGLGMSIEYANMTSLQVRADIMSTIPGSDPIWINMARGGANSAAIKAEEIDVLVAGGPNGQYASVNAAILANGPNDRHAFLSGGGTYFTDSDPGAVGTGYQTNIDALVAKFGGNRFYAMNISYGRYTGGSILSPDYFLSYNHFQIEPRLKATLSRSWATEYDCPVLDDYAGNASDNEQTMTDEVHTNSFGGWGWRERRKPFWRQMYGLTRGDTTLDLLMKQVGSGAKSAMKTRMQALFDSLGSTADATAIANRAAIQARISAIATTYVQDAVTAPALLPDDPSISSATLVAQFDAADFARVDRYWTGHVKSLVDRKSGFTMTQAGTDPTMNYPLLTPAQSDGTKARMYFGGPTKLASVSSSDAGLIGFLDTANQAYTMFAVFSIEALIANGQDIFAIGNASVNFIILAISPNSTNPRIFLGDGGGSGFYTPGDSGVVLGQKTVIAFRNNGTGTTNGVKYYRGAFTNQGTNARVAAKTGTGARIGTRFQGSVAPFQGDIHEIDLFTGAMSDAEVANVMEGLRQKWGAV